MITYFDRKCYYLKLFLANMLIYVNPVLYYKDQLANFSTSKKL